MSLVSATEVPLSISNAIKKASKATGAEFSYLLKTAARESSFNKGAKAKTSSAAGLFQFIESTWLKTVKEVGDKFGLGKYTPHIFTTRSGRAYVPNQNLRQEILELRYNPEVSAMMAGAFTQKNSEFIASQLGREPSQGELYIAHFLGPKGASDLISTADKRPNTRADRLFPSAARANKQIFYSRGKPRTVAQVYKNLVRDHANLQTTASVGAAPEAAPAQIKWQTSVTAAQPAPAAQQIASAQSVRPVVPDRSANSVAEPVTFFSYPDESAPTTNQLPVRKVSLYPPMPVPLDGFSGVEAAIIPNPNHGYSAKNNQSIGLAGQKTSPIAPATKVAALTHTGLNIVPGTMNDAVPGSLGVWTTIVRPPEGRQEAVLPPPASAANGTEKSDKSENHSTKHRRSSRSPGLLEQSSLRNSTRPRIATASADRISNENFWVQMSLNSN